MIRLRRLYALPLGSLLFVCGTLFSVTRVPSFTWLNSGLRIEYGLSAAAASVVGALGAALVAWTLARAGRFMAAALALLALGFGLQALNYRLLAEGSGISERRLFGTTTMSWQEVSRVEAGSRWVVLWGPGETQVRIDTSTFAPEERARLDRTIARRVREHVTH